MKRVLVALSALLVVLAIASPAVSTSTPLASVKAIAIALPDDNGYGLLRNICTTSAIGDGTKWLSAAHCVSDPRFRYYIDGEQVQVAAYDEKNDLVILTTRRVVGKPLSISKNAPNIGQSVLILGYPLGFEDLFQSVGDIMGFVVMDDPGGNTREFTIMQAPGAPGNSGSPVLNMRGEIISVVQIGWSRSFSPVLGGVSHESLRAFVSKALGI